MCFWQKEKAETFKQGQMHFPAPDFMAEVLSPSNEERDRETKFQDYAAHEVQEYWIIDPAREFVEQYILRDDHYELIQKTDSGILKSQVVSGFRIPAMSLFDEKQHLKTLREVQEHSPQT